MARNSLLIFGLAIISVVGCQKKRENLPLITTLDLHYSSGYSAQGGGVLYFDGNSKVTAKGLCWSTMREPTTSDMTIIAGTGAESFIANINNLKPGTNYFVRAFATNALGTTYGNEMSYQCPPLGPPPEVLGFLPSSVSTGSALAKGSVQVGDKIAPVLRCGLCWSSSGIPDTNDSAILLKPDNSGTFTANISGLQNGTSYTLCAFATNSAGITYSQPQIFKTYYGTVSDIHGNVYYTTKVGSQEWMAENLKVTRYRNGVDIPYLPGDNVWGGNNPGAGYCYYENNTHNSDKYGNLYNHAVVTSSNNVAIEGWHVPSADEYTQLLNALGSSAHESMKFPDGDWDYNYGSNSSGFSAKAGGYRGGNGYFYGQGSLVYFWTTTNYSQSNAQTLQVLLFNTLVFREEKRAGASIRLVRD